MEILTARSRSAVNRIQTCILTYGILGWGFRLLERCLVLFLLWVLLVGLTVWLETALGLRPWLSLVFRLAGLLPMLALGFFWLRGFFRRRPTIGGMSRELEKTVPGLRSRLVTAVEFRRELALPGQGILRYFSPGLVNAFFVETQRAARPRCLARALARPTLGAAVLGLAIVLGAAAMLPQFTRFEWRSVLNVYLAPFHRNPFYDPTTLLVEPGDIQVTVGDDVTVRARLIGRETRSSEIWFHTVGMEPDRVRMVSGDDGAFVHQFRNLQESVRYGVVSGKKRSPEYEIRVVKRINLTELSIQLAYPSYTGMGLGLGGKEEGSIEAPIGTRCRLAAQFDEEASEAVLHLRQTDGKEIETHARMKPTAADWEAEFTVLGDGAYSIAAEWDGGSPGESPQYQIKAIRDASPSVELLTPRTNVDLSGKAPLPAALFFHEGNPNLTVQYRARDDLGLRESHLVVEDAAGNTLDRVPMHVFTGTAAVAEATYPWALRDWWGGEDVWVCVEVKDSLAARPDLAREFYDSDEIRRHTVTSRRVRVSWKEPPQIARGGDTAQGSEADSGQERGDGQAIGEMNEGPQGEGSRVPIERKGGDGGAGERAQQLVREADDIREQQEDLNQEITRLEIGPGEQAGKSSSEGTEGQKATADEVREGTPTVRPDELGERQRSLAERTAELENRVRDLASDLRSQPDSGSEASLSEEREGKAGQGQKEERSRGMASDLDRAADRLSRQSVRDGDRLRPGIGTQMEQNVADLDRRSWDEARSRGEVIARDLEDVGEMLDRVSQQADLAGGGDEGQRDGPGGGKEQSVDAAKQQQPETGEGLAESAKERQMGDQAGGDETAGPSSPLGGQAGDTSADRRAPSSVLRANAFTNIRFKLPEDYMTEFDTGEGTEAAVPPGKRDFGKGIAARLDKVPTQYRDEVNRYYELLESP